MVFQFVDKIQAQFVEICFSESLHACFRFTYLKYLSYLETRIPIVYFRPTSIAKTNRPEPVVLLTNVAKINAT